MQMMGYSYAYRIVMARSGLVAVERVKQRRDTDLVVVEYRLPAMSGIDVMKEIKDVEPSVLVIIVTAYGDGEVAVEAFRSGARDYLKKPFSISEPSRRKNILPGSDTPAQPGTPSAAVTLSQYHKIQQAVRFINDNYRTAIRLDAAARKSGMSPVHHSRVFEKVMACHLSIISIAEE
jgi:CheY-like chemotaxis protein